MFRVPPAQQCAHVISHESAQESLIARRVGKEDIYVPQSSEQASSTRHALAKEMYARVFRWVVSKVNEALDVHLGVEENQKVDVKSHRSRIGILYVFFMFSL